MEISLYVPSGKGALLFGTVGDETSSSIFLPFVLQHSLILLHTTDIYKNLNHASSKAAKKYKFGVHSKKNAQVATSLLT